jgi:hypothetical protein
MIVYSTAARTYRRAFSLDEVFVGVHPNMIEIEVGPAHARLSIRMSSEEAAELHRKLLKYPLFAVNSAATKGDVALQLAAAEITYLNAKVARLKSTLEDISRKPEVDEESAQRVAREALAVEAFHRASVWRAARGPDGAAAHEARDAGAPHDRRLGLRPHPRVDAPAGCVCGGDDGTRERQLRHPVCRCRREAEGTVRPTARGTDRGHRRPGRLEAA